MLKENLSHAKNSLLALSFIAASAYADADAKYPASRRASTLLPALVRCTCRGDQLSRAYGHPVPRERLCGSELQLLAADPRKYGSGHP